MNEKAKYWLELAHYDIDSAAVMLDGSRYLYVGFMCHQTIEKGLKAYYSDINDDNPPYIHNLIRLSELTGLLGVYSGIQKQFILSLNPLNIATRYPVQKQKLEILLNKEYCNKLIKDTEALLLWIEHKLSK